MQTTSHPQASYVRVWCASRTDVFAPEDLFHRLSVSIEERLALAHAVASYLGELRTEISSSNNADERRDLVTEAHLLNSVRCRLEVDELAIADR